MSRLFSLTKDEAVNEVRAVAAVVDGWKEHFANAASPRATSTSTPSTSTGPS